MRNNNLLRVLAFAVTAVVLSSCQEETTSVAPLPTASFTAQAQAGATAYVTHCATCHGANLQGTALGPILSGAGFLIRWGQQSPADFYNNIRANMPPGGNQGISTDDYLNIVAHIMSSNGVPESNPLLTTDAAYPLAGNIPGAANLVQTPGTQVDAPTGVIAPGTVENFTPVTDAMLADPDPGDWPMLRRNYQAWSYSPLDQVNTGNVSDLRLEWVWSMHEGIPSLHPWSMMASST